jgi:hypothetical protein
VSKTKGKSRYAEKSSNKPKPVKVKTGPVNYYQSVCCKVQATKQPCGRVGNGKDGKTPEWKGLGGWRCSNCNELCKVTVRKAEECKANTLNLKGKSSDFGR